MANIGRVKQIIGPVLDVSFSGEGSKLPEIFNALEIKRPNGEVLVLEVQQHLLGRQLVALLQRRRDEAHVTRIQCDFC